MMHRAAKKAGNKQQMTTIEMPCNGGDARKQIKTSKPVENQNNNQQIIQPQIQKTSNQFSDNFRKHKTNSRYNFKAIQLTSCCHTSQFRKSPLATNLNPQFGRKTLLR